MLRLNFRSIKGDAPTLTVATFFRFHADGTLRGPENYLVARCVDGCWRLSGRMHRELDCEGPVKLRFSMGANDVPVMLGPFGHVRTAARHALWRRRLSQHLRARQKSGHFRRVPRADAAVGRRVVTHRDFRRPFPWQRLTTTRRSARKKTHARPGSRKSWPRSWRALPANPRRVNRVKRWTTTESPIGMDPVPRETRRSP